MKRIFILIAISFSLQGYSQESGKPLPAWQEGMLDLHHINTGRGDAAFFVLPDGTTFLLDAGEMPPDNNSPRRTQLQPNDSKHAHEWIVYYIRKFLRDL